MSTPQPLVLSAPADGVDVGKLTADLDAINAQLLSMFTDANELLAQTDVDITDEANASGKLWRYQPAVMPIPMRVDADGRVVAEGDPGSPAQWVNLTSDEYAALKSRIDLLRKLTQLVSRPIAQDQPSYVQMIRKNRRRWETV